MRSYYEQRRKPVIAAFNQEFGDLVSLPGDNAGINVLVRFKVPVDDELLIREARKLGVALPSTRQFYSSGVRSGEFLLNYGGLDVSGGMSGIARLAEAFTASRVNSCWRL